MTEQLLDRETVGRVLRRASDLSDNEQEPLPQLGGVSEQALVEAAGEVGISAVAVRRALAIERLDPLPRHHVGDRLVGAPVVAVDAEVCGSAADLLARMDAWLVDGHHLRRDRLRDCGGVCGPSAAESSGARSARCASPPVKGDSDSYAGSR